MSDATPVLPDAEEQSPLEKLDLFERQFLLAYLKLGNQTNAYASLKKCKTRHSAEVCASRTMLRIKAKIGKEALWELAGISEVEIGKVMREGMNATYVKHMVVPRKGGGAELVACQPVPDGQTRLRAAELAANVMGLTKRRGEDSGGKVTVFIETYAKEGGDGAGSKVAIQVSPP